MIFVPWSNQRAHEVISEKYSLNIDDFYENINIQLNRALIAGESVVLAGILMLNWGKTLFHKTYMT